MKLKGLVDEDFLQYRKPCMFLIFPYCTFKCDNEAGTQICQNCSLANAPILEIDTDKLVERYLSNDLTKSIVCGGLEPLDTFDDLLELVAKLRAKTSDDIVIYTGYKNDEISDKIDILKRYSNIIIKFGRFIPNQESHYDEVLGVNLASNNQYAVKIS